MPRGPKHPDRIRAQQRRAQAIDLKLRGHSMTEIAQLVGVGLSRAYELVNEGLDATAQEISTGRDRLRAQEAKRLEIACEAIWPRVLEGDYRAHDVFHKNRALLFKLLGLEMAEPAQEVHLHGPINVVHADADRRMMDMFRQWADRSRELGAGDVIEGEATDERVDGS